MVTKLGSSGALWVIYIEFIGVFEKDCIGWSYSIGIDVFAQFYIAEISLKASRLEDPIHTYPTP